MKTIGLLGGMSWESTANYYQAINLGIKAALGGLHSAKLVLYNVDFDEIEKLQHVGNWQQTATILVDAAKKVEAAGADFILICTNTMHKVAEDIEKAVSIPLLHIADATAMQLVEKGVSKVGLLGTQFTMAQDFYKKRLTDKYGIEVLVPDEVDQQIVHDIIYQELCLGEIKSESHERYLHIMDKLSANGVEGIILGCTEIAMLVQQNDTDIPLYDTTEIHASAAVKKALEY